jgi:rhamnulokinase
MRVKNIIAIDLGAASGRVIRVKFDGERYATEDIHRFPNIPIQVRDTLYWDVLHLWREMVMGIEAALDGADSIGIDTWGVDWALLDRNGMLLANPAHYRDSRTDGMMDWVFERVPRRTIFDRTGLQFMQLNSLYQLASLVRDNSPLLDVAETYLPFPDLFNYWLTGEISAEYTHATTTQFYNAVTKDWDRETLSTLGIPTDMFPKIVEPGTIKGEYKGVKVIAPGTHDTASAVVAVPATTEDYLYISSGTWSLMGLEIPEPIINDASYETNITNEGGVYGTIRLLKNVAGMWLAQQCREEWLRQGRDYDYPTMAEMATTAEAFRSLVDPDDPMFIPPGDMPSYIREFCRRANQPIPETEAQFLRAIYESLALKYRFFFDKLLAISGRNVTRIHIIGGGSQNDLLNQMTADACNCEVVAGPVEATALGNAITQLITLGEIENIAQARELLSRATDTKTYQPRHVAAWEEAYQRYLSILA